MNLSAHFTLEEMIFSDTARRLSIDNTPSRAILTALQRTAERLELVRSILDGAPIRITSGYRCVALNRALMSLDTSAHVQGLAADFVAPSRGTPLELARELATYAGSLQFDQLIWEYDDWVHIGWRDGPPRQQVLTIDDRGTLEGLTP